MKKIILLPLMLLLFNGIYSQNYQKQVENNNIFSFELLSLLSGNDNLFLSPFSVSTALAMTYEGARNKTRAEMSDVLHFPENSETLNRSFKDLISDTQKSNNDKLYRFVIANSIWAQKDFNFLHSYFNTIKEYYDAEIQGVNFKIEQDRSAAIKKINSWVAKKTGDKIKKLLNSNSVDNDTKAVLVNAVYFSAKWEKVFSDKQTKTDIFYGISGETKKDFMHVKNRMRYTEKNGIKFLEIPYANKKASMIIIMPDSFENFTSKFNFKSFSELYKNAEYENIDLYFPKFKTEYKADLAKILIKAGIKRAFTNKADFSGMTCKKELKIDKVIHQTYINIDESGTEAAAATAVVMKRITAINPSDVITFKADKPFVYVIRENSTGSILFAGQLVK